MGRFKGRNAVACRACHSQKLKCNGGSPCQRCELRNRECIYPEKEKYYTLPESYVRKLEREVTAARQSCVSPASPSTEETSGSLPRGGEAIDSVPLSELSDSRAARTQLREDCSAERFVHKLKEVSSSLNPLIQPDLGHLPFTVIDSGYTYLRLNCDFSRPKVVIKLPPRPFAMHLLDLFEEIFGDYHWFLRMDFRTRLSLTYSDPASQSNDRNWLCRVSVVLALAQTVAYKDVPLNPMYDKGGSAVGETHAGAAPLPPGSDLFEQALQLLSPSFEEPVPEDVEALNLIAFYCYSLNRRKTAFVYASQSVTLAKLLHMDRPQPNVAGCSPVQIQDSRRVVNEHMVRLWWTAFCMDRMVAAELGVSPVQTNIPEVQLPSSTHLLREDLPQFFDPHVLTAHTQLCEMKRRVANTVTGLLRNSNGYDIFGTLQPCLDELHQWRQRLPSHLEFCFDSGIPPTMRELPSARGVASLYLRYHQCFTVLLRPFYLQDFLNIMQNRAASGNTNGDGANPADHERRRGFKIGCLQAAQRNCRILSDLFRHGKLAKFGYWDSIHLFSALAVLALSKAIISAPMGAVGYDDDELYSQSRVILEEMARAGNPAAKDHVSLLSEVETLSRTISVQVEHPLPSDTANFGLWGPQFIFGDLGFDELMIDQLWTDMDWTNLDMIT
ncbi:hypothetical protein GQ53DRAFT_793732 [Thozetella sp. PMI_491]|nr:hypothetical protein GQ53DRAFT_793732 [Thozetella sp. PMI_491]